MIISINVEYYSKNNTMCIKNFETVVNDVSEVHHALMDSIRFVNSIGEYHDHTILIHSDDRVFVFNEDAPVTAQN